MQTKFQSFVLFGFVKAESQLFCNYAGIVLLTVHAFSCRYLGPVCYRCLNNSFQFLNNITRIFTHFFTHTYFQKIQTTLLEIFYQMGPYFVEMVHWKFALYFLNKFRMHFLKCTLHSWWSIFPYLTIIQSLNYDFSCVTG